MSKQLPLFDLPDEVDPEREHFPTPPGIADFAAQWMARQAGSRELVFDPGAGGGVWGKAIRRRFPGRPVIVGNDLPGVRRSPAYNLWLPGDLLVVAPRLLAYPGIRFRFFFGNPPFSLAEQFVRWSYALLQPGGIGMFLLRVAFLAGQRRQAGLHKEIPVRAVTVLGARPSFTLDGVSDPAQEYMLIIYKKGYEGETTLLPGFNYKDPLTWKWSENYVL